MIFKENENLKSQDRENVNKLIYFEKSVSQFEDENNKLKKDLEQSKNDCEQMIKMMESYEIKV